MENFFVGKKVLFIAPAFFGYEKEIQKRLLSLGALVTYFDDRPSGRAFSKVLIRVMPKMQKKEIRNYFNSILEKAGGNFDFVFIIKLECMPLDILKKLRADNSKAKFVYYSYDSVKNNRNIKNAVQIFDSAFTFDPEDVDLLPGIRFRPLFFLNDYRDLAHQEIKYDLSFVGTAHSDRYRLVKKVKAAMLSKNHRTFFFLFMPNRWICALRRLLMPAFWGSSEKDFSFVSLPKKNLLDVVASSAAILDFQHPNQTGLTMRTIEMLGAQRKMLTTNTCVKKYDFYRPENIAVIDRGNPVIDSEFFSRPYSPLPEEIYEKYSIDGWLKEVFSIPDRLRG